MRIPRFAVAAISAALVVALPSGGVSAASTVKALAYDSSGRATSVGDLLLPDAVRPDTPVVLVIHGGGWSWMSRRDLVGVANFFRDELGFAAFNIDYRLASPANRWPACGDDCVNAAKFLLSEDFRRKSGLSPSKIWICGASSGGHLALWTAMSLPRESVAGVVAISPIGDPAPDFAAHPERYTALLGENPQTFLAKMDPCRLIAAGVGAPVLITHARDDQVVPVASSRAFAAAYAKAGGRCETFEYPSNLEPNGGGHFIWRAGVSPNRLLAAIENRIAAFVRANRPADPDALASGFDNVPMANRPWCYWWWLNGHVDRKTITADLEAMRKLGFGGLLMFDSRGYWDDVDHVLMAKPEIEFASPKWQDHVAFSIREANRLGLEFTMNISSSGGKLDGPWAVGADAPKRLMGRVVPLPSGRRFAVDWMMPALPHYRDVAVFAVRYEGPAVPDRTWFPATGDGTARKVTECVELTDRITSDSKFAWNVPKDGQWALLRFGWCAIPGHEHDVDVLDPKAVEGHWHRVFGPLRERVGDLFGKTLTHVYSVSWEGSFPTWTPAFEEEFGKSTGYGLRSYLPCLAGFDASGLAPDGVRDRGAFVKDFRRTRNLLFREKFYGTIGRLAHGAGLKWYSESGGPWNRAPDCFQEADQGQYLAVNDFPQGEFWYNLPEGASPLPHCRGIASAAHVYGKRRAAAEAFTHMMSHWSVWPFGLKRCGDEAFADGINHFVWHTFTCSPAKFGVPGHEYFAGTHINRNVTWHNELGAFVKYLGRCQWLLQQGLPVADFAVWNGAAPYQGFGHFREKSYAKSPVALPRTAAYDIMGTDALLTRVSVRDGRVTLPDGMSYGALVLDPENAADRTPTVVRKIAELKDAGAKVVETADATAFLSAMKLDFSAPEPFVATHRRAGEDDIYFVSGSGRCEATFDVTGKVAELWDATDGRRVAAEIRPTADGRSAVMLDLPRSGSVFVVFRRRHGKLDARPKESGHVVPADGEWNASFAYHPGIKAQPPKSRRFALGNFSKDPDFEVAHFSGAVTYRTTFRCASDETGPATLSLGDLVGGVATVRINGSDLGVVWAAPWEVRVPQSVLKTGENVLEVHFVNAWANRIIGDCKLPPEKRVTSSNLSYHKGVRKDNKPTIWSGYTETDWLKPNGLLGPVVLRPDAQEAPARLDLAVRGNPEVSVIVIAKDASPSVRHAAEELRDFTALATGVRMPIVDDGRPLPKAAVLIGKTAHTAKVLGGRAPAEGLGDDGFRLVACPPHLVIEGSAVRGALYGVYELLERHAGCRWYASWHTVVPKAEALSVPADLDRAERPAFAMREPYWYDVTEHPEFSARLRANNRSWHETEAKFGGDAFRFGKGLGSCHTFENLLPLSEFFDAHPEYFALVGGRRVKERSQPCLTNPEVLKIVTARVLEGIRRDPGAVCYGVSQNDCANWCTCPKCKAVDDEEGSHAGTVIRFVNAVAEAVEREFPGKRVETLAYCHTRKPPSRTRPRRNVTICLCSIECDFARPFAKSVCPDNKSFLTDLAGWSKLTDRLYVWDYTTDFPDFPAPFPNVYSLQDNIRTLRDHGVAWLFEQGGCNGRHAGFAELKAWLLAKLMWNPDVPLEPLLDDFFSGYYGAAAPYARRAFDIVHAARFARSSDRRGFLKCFEQVEDDGSPDPVWEDCAELWERAVAAVADDPVRAYNVRMSAFSCDYMRLRRYLAQSETVVRFVPRSDGASRLESEMRKVAKSLLERMDEAKDIRLAEDGARNDEIRASWIRFLGSKPGSDAVSESGVVGAEGFDLKNPGKWCAWADDPKAMGGKAVRIFPSFAEWCAFFPCRKVAFKPGERYTVRAHVRVDRKPGAKGAAFWSGVYDYGQSIDRRQFEPAVESLKGDGYAWYDILTWVPSSGDRFWISAGRPGAAGPAAEAVWIDAIEFVPAGKRPEAGMK